MRRAGGIAWQHVRHEEAAAFAAAAEAALTGELAVCAASCGPGNLHLINGLFDANRSRVPVLAIAAQIPEDEIGSEYFQETHPQYLFQECSVYCELVSEPEQMPRVLEIAMRTALARGGVSVVVIPGGVFFADVPSGAKAVPVRAATAVIRPDDSSLAAAAEVLNSAQRVTILAGAGCAIVYGSSLRLHPRTRHGRCGGTGEHRSRLFPWVFRKCGRCASGRIIRWGAGQWGSPAIQAERRRTRAALAAARKDHRWR